MIATMHVPFVDLKAQHRALRAADRNRGPRRLRAGRLHPRGGGRTVRNRVRRAHRHAPRDCGRQWSRRHRAGAARLRRRPRRRGDHRRRTRSSPRCWRSPRSAPRRCWSTWTATPTPSTPRRLPRRSGRERVRSCRSISYGQPVDLDGVMAVATRHNLLVVEDAAQAHGARYGDRRAGSFGHAAAYSFYPSKNLGAYGDGGIIVTNDDAAAEQAPAVAQLRPAREVLPFRVRHQLPPRHAPGGGPAREAAASRIVERRETPARGRLWRKTSRGGSHARRSAEGRTHLPSVCDRDGRSRPAAAAPSGAADRHRASTIPCRRISRKRARRSDTRRATSRGPRQRQPAFSRCRCIPSSRTRRSTTWSKRWPMHYSEGPR